MRVNMEGKVMAVYLDDGSRLGELPARDPDPEPGRYALEEMLEAVRAEAKKDVGNVCPHCSCLNCVGIP